MKKHNHETPVTLGGVAVVPGEIVGYEQDIPVVKTVEGKVVNCDRLNVRKEGNLNGEIVGTIPVGSSVRIEFYDNDWIFVTLPSGITGFVMAKFIKEVR